MAGFMNDRFVFGMALASDLPQEDRFRTALLASQFPANSIGPVLLKPTVDTARELETVKKELEDARQELAKEREKDGEANAAPTEREASSADLKREVAGLREQAKRLEERLDTLFKRLEAIAPAPAPKAQKAADLPPNR